MRYCLTVVAISGFSLAVVGCSNSNDSFSETGLNPTPQKPIPSLSPSPDNTVNKQSSTTPIPQSSEPNSSNKVVENKQTQISFSKPPASSPKSSSELGNTSTKKNVPSNQRSPTSSDLGPWGDPKPGQDVPISGGAYVNASGGLFIRNAPAGYVIGKLANGQRVSLTGAEQYAGGRNWSQLASGGWIASEYLSYR